MSTSGKICRHCGKDFNRMSNMKRHQKYCKNSNTTCQDHVKCAHCDQSFARKDTLVRHLKICKLIVDPAKDNKLKTKLNEEENPEAPPPKKQRKIQKCDVCQVKVEHFHSHLKTNEHKNKISEKLSGNVEIIKSSFKSRIASYRIHSAQILLTAVDFMMEVKEQVLQLITSKQCDLESAVKVNFELFALFSMANKKEDEGIIEDIKSFNTKNKIIQFADNLDEVYNAFMSEIAVKADEFQERDSGWAIDQVIHLEVNINKFSPMSGKSYLPLPKWVQEKRACINVRNEDNACFAWAVISALFPVQCHPERVTSYPNYNTKLDLNGITFPMTLSDIKHFEARNNISVNVYEICGEDISGPLYYTQKKQEKHVNLLYIEDGEKSHYCWIKNLSRLISSQLRHHHGKVWICDGCLLNFPSEGKLLEHNKGDCSQVKTSVPSEIDNILKFKNHRNQMTAPVIVYADFESILKPISTCPPDNNSSYTQDYQIHEAHSFGYYIKCEYDDTLSKYVTYRGENCVKNFLSSLEEELKPFAKVMTRKEPMKRLTSKQKYEYRSAVNCHICNEGLNDDRVRDHCHINGEFRGAAHKACNLNYRAKHVIPIALHNLSKYDAHFIIKMLGGYKANILPKNKENFISFTIKNKKLGVDFRFIDTYRFLPSSLEKLALNLEAEQFVAVKKLFPEHTHLITKKGVFPYNYVDSIEKLNEKHLPPKDCFNNNLNKCDISDLEYDHAQRVWRTFNISSLGEYSDLYLKTDVLILGDVFENFRRICHNTYSLDPAHYYTAPGLSWDAMLKFTNINLELLTDIAMIKFIMRGIRGGLSVCCGKYAKANNKYMADYDSSSESKYILYLDANNQYGWAMSQPIPFKDFRWMDNDEISRLNINQLQSDADKGYFLEVDLEYPPHLHDLHNDLPFCPENVVPDCSKSKITKLIASLHHKRNYVIHYVNLKQALDNGLKLKKIHRVLEFSQSSWLQKYIDLNTEMRTRARNAFEKDFFKLMNNAVFGKTMENVDKRVDVRIVNEWNSQGRRLGARALISRINFNSCTIIDENLTIIQMNRNNVTYNKPIYIGFTVLELSKTLMYDFHYKFMLPKYNENINLLYTDTDSFIYEIKTNDFFDDIRNDVDERFDTSDYPENNKYNLPLVNKKVVGKFKDECAGRLIKEFIGIRSKCYYVGKENDENIKKIKGITKSVVSMEITEQDFRDCLDKSIPLRKQMNVIKSRAHTIYSQTLNKVALQNRDDKRFIIPNDKYKTLAWGHKYIQPNIQI